MVVKKRRSGLTDRFFSSDFKVPFQAAKRWPTALIVNLAIIHYVILLTKLCATYIKNCHTDLHPTHPKG